MSTVLLNLTDISYTYFSVPVLNGLNWEIQDGQKIGLVGANGGGKSTLLKLITGELTPESGTIFRIKDLTIGYLPQDVGTDLTPYRSPLVGKGDLTPLLALEGENHAARSTQHASSTPPFAGREGEVKRSSMPSSSARPRLPGCAAPWPSGRR